MSKDDVRDEDVPFLTVNYKEIARDRDLSSITRSLAWNICETGYLTVGHFLQSLNDSDIQTLLDMIHDSQVSDEEEEGGGIHEELVLITLMLNAAETTTEQDSLDTLLQKCNVLTTLILCTSLHRKGLVDCAYENFSLQEDMHTAVVARRKDGLSQDDIDRLLSGDDDDE